MPKNKGKGGKSFKAGNAKGVMHNQRDEIIMASPEEHEEYAQVRKPLGNLRLEVQLVDGSKKIGVIRGAMVRKSWIARGDVVLVSKREFNENDVVDIIHRYTPQDVRKLVRNGTIPRDFSSAGERGADNAHSDYIFVADDHSDDDPDVDENNDLRAIDRHKVVLDDPLADFDDL